MDHSYAREAAEQREIDEKKAASQSIRPVSSPESNEDVERSADPSWAPGFWARFPWLGFIALVTILITSGASVLTLMLSNKKSETQWVKELPPNVILNQMNNVANLCFGLAIGNGVAIAWWRKTLQGATIEQLHRSWTFSTSIKNVVLAGKYFNFIALAALTAKLTIVDSSLMQKAFSTYVGMDVPHNVTNISGHVNETIPITSREFGRSFRVTMSQALNVELQLWSQSGNVFPNRFENCEGTCYLNVPAAGFEINCNEAVVDHVDYGLSTVQAAILNSDLNSMDSGTFTGGGSNLTANSSASTIAQARAYRDANYVAPLFNVTFETKRFSPEVPDQDGTNYSYIAMELLSSDAVDGAPPPVDQSSPAKRQDSTGNAKCPGKVTRQSCRLRPAVISYPLQITNYTGRNTLNGIKLGTPLVAEGNSSSVDLLEGHYDLALRQQEGFKVIRYNDIYYAGPFDDPSLIRLGGLTLGFETYLGGQASMIYDGIKGYQPDISGTAYKYLQSAVEDENKCGYGFINPLEPGLGGTGLTTLTQSVAASINQIMLLNTMKVPSAADPDGWDLDSGPLPVAAFNATMYRDTVHYSTNIWYMIGAVIANFICVLCVLPSYYGFWQLGRKVALSPFEIAAAFRSPMVDTSGTIEDIIKEKGAQPVQFGHIVTGDAAGRLGVAEPEYVERAHPAIGSAKKEISEKFTGVFGGKSATQ